MELKLHPPIVMLLCAGLMKLLASWLPLAALPLPPAAATGLALVLAAAGVVSGMAGVVAFARQRTTVNPHRPERTSALVTGGIYRFTRNPMYLGMALFLAAWALWLGQLTPWLGIWAYVAFINRFQIAPEERVLAEKFGDDWEQFCRRTRRWI